MRTCVWTPSWCVMNLTVSTLNYDNALASVSNRHLWHWYSSENLPLHCTPTSTNLKGKEPLAENAKKRVIFFSALSLFRASLWLCLDLWAAELLGDRVKRMRLDFWGRELTGPSGAPSSAHRTVLSRWFVSLQPQLSSHYSSGTLPTAMHRIGGGGIKRGERET